MGSECGPGGSQSRAVWCAHSEGWTTLHTNCDQSQRPDNQQRCFRVCDWHKDLYDWQLGAWNQCVPVSMRNVGVQRPVVCTKGDEGIQTREVGCVQKANGEPAEDAICEYFEPKPRLEQACLIPCPRDCVVSEFSLWTPCSKTCGIGLQNRIRSVLAPPLFGGATCPNLTEFQTCLPTPCGGEESLYSLRVGPWGPCSVPLPRQARAAHKTLRDTDRPSRDRSVKESDKLSKESDKLPKEDDRPPRNRDKQSRKADKLPKDEAKPPKATDKLLKESEKLPKDDDKSANEDKQIESDKQEKAGEKRPKEGGKLKANKDKSKRKLAKANRNPDRASRQADKAKRKAKKAKNKEKREKMKERAQERLREKGKVKDPETSELIKKKRNRNRQNRPGGKSWALQMGYQTREVSCVHKSGTVEALR